MSQHPYLGCLISLVSQADVRYEGTLQCIDQLAATLTVSQVRSFGTEGRRNGAREIAPTEALFDLIVFRASDIRDLKVLQLPVQQQFFYQEPLGSPLQQQQQQQQSRSAKYSRSDDVFYTPQYIEVAGRQHQHQHHQPSDSFQAPTVPAPTVPPLQPAASEARQPNPRKLQQPHKGEFSFEIAERLFQDSLPMRDAVFAENSAKTFYTPTSSFFDAISYTPAKGDKKPTASRRRRGPSSARQQ